MRSLALIIVAQAIAALALPTGPVTGNFSATNLCQQC